MCEGMCGGAVEDSVLSRSVLPVQRPGRKANIFIEIFTLNFKVYLSLCFLGFHIRTGSVTACFPMEYQDTFQFQKDLPSYHSRDIFEEETVYIELLQVT